LLQTFWQEIIKECQKENLVPAITPKELSQSNAAITSTVPSSSTLRVLTKDFSELQQNDSKKKSISSLCCDILHELENKSYAHLFYKCVEKDAKHPMDLFTIKSKLENNQYTKLEEFEKDIYLIFHNCYTFNDAESEIYHLGKALETVFNKKLNEKLNLQDGKETRKLKRIRDNDTTDADTSKLL
jgi:hypothetical protein